MNKRFEFVDSNNNIFSLIITDNKEHTAELTSVNLDSEFKGELIIPSSITYQGTPYTITSIREDDYKEYINITSIKVPYSVTSIGKCTFLNYSSLLSINVDANNKHYSSIDGVLYNKTKTDLISCPLGKKGDIVIPNSVTSIGDCAFAFCIGLTAITIPDCVTSIGYMAFDYCNGLTKITIPNSVKSIGQDAFINCKCFLPNDDLYDFAIEKW